MSKGEKTGDDAGWPGWTLKFTGFVSKWNQKFLNSVVERHWHGRGQHLEARGERQARQAE